MPSLCDANLLLALCYDRHSHHQRALVWLEEQETRNIILCRATQQTLLRLFCNTAVMGADVCTLAQAWTIYDSIVADDRFEFYAEPEQLEVVWRKLTQADKVSPKLWQDAYLAAFAIAARLQLATFDCGFQQFSGLTLKLLENLS